MATATVLVVSGWQSKINWTQLVAPIMSVVAILSAGVPSQYSWAVPLVVQTLQSALTAYFKTFQTTSITPSSAAKL